MFNGDFRMHTKVETAYDELSSTHHPASTISWLWQAITRGSQSPPLLGLCLAVASQVRRSRDGHTVLFHVAKTSPGPELRGKLWVIYGDPPKTLEIKEQQNWALAKFYSTCSQQSNNRFHEDLRGRIFNAELGCSHNIVCQHDCIQNVILV